MVWYAKYHVVLRDTSAAASGLFSVLFCSGWKEFVWGWGVGWFLFFGLDGGLRGGGAGWEMWGGLIRVVGLVSRYDFLGWNKQTRFVEF